MTRRKYIKDGKIGVIGSNFARYSSSKHVRPEHIPAMIFDYDMLEIIVRAWDEAATTDDFEKKESIRKEKNREACKIAKEKYGFQSERFDNFGDFYCLLIPINSHFFVYWDDLGEVIFVLEEQTIHVAKDKYMDNDEASK